nr:MAG TPA: helix-turn-helix domain protein [Caudoviricetes sp.]
MMLYTVSEVARILKVNRNFVYDEIKKGNIKAVRIGSIKIREDKLEEYINEKEGDYK